MAMGGVHRQARRALRGARRVYRRARRVYRRAGVQDRLAARAPANGRHVIELARRDDAFFDVEWYAAQTDSSSRDREQTDSSPRDRAQLVAHAHRSMDRRTLSPHPLYLPAWAASRLPRDEREQNSETYLRLFTPGWPDRMPHPLIDLEHVASNNPESVDDPDGVFGWLLKRIGAGESPRTLAAVDVDWQDVRSRQLSAVRRQRRHAARVRRWRDGREAETYDWQVDADTVRRFTGAEAAPVAAPTVSVVMPAFDRAGQLGTAIESVQAQTLGSWELVVADDGSSDDTVAVARRYAAADSRISVLELEHRGVSAARNCAVEATRGTWIAFLDTDNTWVPHYLEVMVAALTAAGADHGYSALLVEGDDEVTTYRTLEGADTLDIGNHIDLNIWMARRERVRAVGMFDESLRRAVDYDLIWRVAKEYEPLYVPFIGSRYTHRSEGPERITATESFNWKDVVRGKNLIDWAAVAQQERQPGVAAVVVWTGERYSQLSRTLRHLGQECPGVDEVVVVGTHGDRAATVVVHAEQSVSPKIREVAGPSIASTALLANAAFIETTRSHLLFVRPGTTVPDPGVTELVAAVDDGAVVSQPIVLDGRGVVLHAGWNVLDSSPVPPSPFLEGHHPVDTGRLPDRTTTDSAALAAMVTSASSYLELHGFDPLYGYHWFEADYCLRARRLAPEPVTTCRVFAQAVPRRDLGTDIAVRSAAQLLQSHPALAPDAADQAWRATPLERHGLEFDPPSPENPFLKPPRPLLAPRPGRYATGGADGPLRIAIKHCAPAGAIGETWGDTYFAGHLADAFAEHGHDVLVDNRESAMRPSVGLDMVNVVIRGVRAIHPVPGALNVLWVISRPERVRPEDLVGFDLVYVASNMWASRATARFGRPIRPLLQATDTGTFRPYPRDKVDAPQALFVGNRRAEYRRPVGEGMAQAAGRVDVGIYGGGWHRDGIGPPVLRGQFLPNAELPLHYSAAELVLNDHFPSMRDFGFVNNRILDSLACGTPVLSDRVPGAEELFEDKVLWYDDPGQIPDIMVDYLRSPWPEERRAEVAQWVATHYSFDARARVMLEEIGKAIRER